MKLPIQQNCISISILMCYRHSLLFPLWHSWSFKERNLHFNCPSSKVLYIFLLVLNLLGPGWIILGLFNRNLFGLVQPLEPLHWAMQLNWTGLEQHWHLVANIWTIKFTCFVYPRIQVLCSSSPHILTSHTHYITFNICFHTIVDEAHLFP